MRTRICLLRDRHKDKSRQDGTMELLTFQEAAELAGISVKTVMRHIKCGKITAIETPMGRRIHRTELDPYVQLKTDRGGLEQTVTGSVGQVETVATGVLDSAGQSHCVPLEAMTAALDFAERRIAEERSRADENQKRADASERMRFALELSLRQYQTVLGEQADSLAQERALRLQSEARLECVPELSEENEREAELLRQQAEWEQERAKLEAENEARLAAFEQEKADLVERLKISESRVSWMEQRVPRWVRSLFRAG